MNSTVITVNLEIARKIYQALIAFAESMKENQNKRYVRAAVAVKLDELNTVLNRENIFLQDDNSELIAQMKTTSPQYHNAAKLLEFARFIEQKKTKETLPAAVQVAVRNL